ncbi:MAG: cyclic nucleotide-binding domain-containing protein [Elusimicrobia bacterium]|nr:cyclic nucleotide-binding domain-containing protein [Elusimicrobiota bacterium]
MKKDLETMLAGHPFCKDFKREQLRQLAGCAANARYETGRFLLRQGGGATRFFLIRRGLVRVELFMPGRGPVLIQTLGPGEALGWSWLVEPYRWAFSARAAEPTLALAFDGACLRRKLDRDSELGYRILKRFIAVLAARLDATRLQLMDIYGDRVPAA